MTRDDFIQRLESYLDEYEGTTPLPDSVRDAVRVHVPRTKQVRSFAGPARYLTMPFSEAAPLALAAAAVLVIAAGAFLVGRENVGSPDLGPSRTADATPASATGSTEICDATTVSATGLGARTLEVAWCAYGVGEPGDVSFSMEAPSSWADFYVPGSGTLWIRPADGGAITLALREDETVDQVVADVTGREGYVATDETPVTLDGVAGVSMDITLADGAPANDAPPLIADDDQTWQLQTGTVTTVWIVDIGGDTLMIAVGENLADAFREALATIEWGS